MIHDWWISQRFALLVGGIAFAAVLVGCLVVWFRRRRQRVSYGSTGCQRCGHQHEGGKSCPHLWNQLRCGCDYDEKQ